MADAAAARREARRRRIIENSHNRLQLISGKNGKECLKESPVPSLLSNQSYEVPIVPENSSHTSPCLFNGVFASPTVPFGSVSDNVMVAAGDGEVVNDLTSTSSLLPEIPQPVPTSTSLWDKLTTHKYDIVLLSLVLQFLNTVSIMTFESTYFFLPVMVYAATKFIWFPTQSNSSIANILLLLNNMSTGRVQEILYLTRCAGAIASDICVFLFVTIFTQSLYIMVKESLT